MNIVDSQVHLWAADSPERPWPPGRAQEACNARLSIVGRDVGACRRD